MSRVQLALRLALALPLTLGPPAVAAPEVDPLARLQAWLDATHDLEARFEQTLLSGALGAGLVESGRLVLERPGRMRWDYEEPERKVALVLGERTRLYVEADAQLWEGRLEPAERVLPSLLTSDRSIAELFHSKVSAAPRPGRDAAFRLSLVPRTAAEAFEEITVTVLPPDYGIGAVEVLDAAGNRMRYEFSQIRRNAGLARGVFDFEPPSGTEIVARP